MNVWGCHRSHDTDGTEDKSKPKEEWWSCLLVWLSFYEKVISCKLVLPVTKVVNAALSLQIVNSAPVIVNLFIVVKCGIVKVSFKLMASIKLKKTSCLKTISSFLTLRAVIASHLKGHVRRLKAAVSSAFWLLWDGKFRLAIEAGGRVLRVWLDSSLNGDHTLQLLLGKEVLPVLILALELFVSAIDSGLFLLQSTNLFLKNLNFQPLLHATSSSTFTVLKSLSSFLIGSRVLLVVICSASINYRLFDILLLFLC